MDRDLAVKLDEEVKKIRSDQDKIQAYLKTVAEQITLIATYLAPTEPTEPTT